MYIVNNGNDSGSSNFVTAAIPLFTMTNGESELNDRLSQLDDRTRREVSRRMGEFQSAEHMEMFINQFQKGEIS